MKMPYVTAGTRLPEGSIECVEHSCGLPGVHCPRCGEVWSSTGVSYPSVPCEEVGTETRGPSVVEFSRFSELRSRLRERIGRIVAPGTHFGAPLIRLDDDPQEIEFYGNWDIFIRAGGPAEALFREIGISCPRARTASKRGDSEAAMLAPEIPVLEGLVATEPTCTLCRRFGTVPDRLALRLGRALPVFRPVEYATVIVWREDLFERMERIFCRRIERQRVAEVDD